MPGGNNRREQKRKYHPLPRGHVAAPRSPSETLEPGYAPQPPDRGGSWAQHPVLKVVNLLMTLVLVALLGAAGGYYYMRTQFDQAGPLEYATVVVVPKGEGVREIAARLEREGVISDRLVFVASTVLYFHVQDKLKAGEYAIKKQASMREVLDTLVEGKAILYSVPIPEGLTSYQIVERLKAHPELTGPISAVPPEGSLLPDTYRFAKGTTREDLIARMRREHDKFLEKVWVERASGLPFKTKQDAVTLASIVEKETSRADERARVAAVYVNRLKKNMRLESDPTIIYGLSGGKGTLGRPIMKVDMAQMTPYNTYRNGGLTPTPITNPGRAALEAVMRPAKTSDLFFVADGTGGHAFAETFEDHKKNVAVWRQVEQKSRDAKAEAEAAKTDASAPAKTEAAAPAKPDAAKPDTTKPGASKKTDNPTSTAKAPPAPVKPKQDTAVTVAAPKPKPAPPVVPGISAPALSTEPPPPAPEADSDDSTASVPSPHDTP